MNLRMCAVFCKVAGVLALAMASANAGTAPRLQNAPKPNATQEQSDYALWRRRRAAKNYEIYHSSGESFRNMARRVADWLVESAGVHCAISDVTTAPRPIAGRDDTVPVFIGKFTDDEILGRFSKGVRGQLDPLAQLGATREHDVLSLFVEMNGRPMLALLSSDEKSLAAAVASAAARPELPLFPERPGSALRVDGDGNTRLPDLSAASDSSGPIYYHCQGFVASEREMAPLQEYLRNVLLRLHAVAGRFDVPPIDLVLYKSPDMKIAVTGSRDLASARLAIRRVDACLGPELYNSIGREIARIVIFQKLGVSGDSWISEGIVEGACEDFPAGTFEFPAAAIANPELRAQQPPRLRARAAAEWLKQIIEKHGENYISQALSRADGFEMIQKAAEEEWLKPAKAVAVSRMPLPRLLPGGPLKAFYLLQDSGAAGANAAFLAAIQQIKDAGGNAVVLTAARTPGARASGFVDLQCSDDELVWRAAECRRAGLFVILRTTWLGQRFGGWVGEPFTTPFTEMDHYYSDIEAVMLHDAALAREMGCGWFFLASELRGASCFPGRAEWWKTTIKKVRDLYPLGLTYAASFEPVPTGDMELTKNGTLTGEYELVPFWTLLDAVAVTGTIPLAIRADAREDTIRAGAADFARRVESVAARTGRSLILAQVGYTATEFAWMSPWRGRGEADNQAQALAFNAFLSQFTEKPWLLGVCIRGIAADPASAGSRGSSVQSRPAMAVVREFFSKFNKK